MEQAFPEKQVAVYLTLILVVVLVGNITGNVGMLAEMAGKSNDVIKRTVDAVKFRQQLSEDLSKTGGVSRCNLKAAATRCPRPAFMYSVDIRVKWKILE